MDKKINFNIDQIADLARLQIEEEDKERLRFDMLEIVGYIEELSALDLSAVEPMHHSTDIQNVFRDDNAEKSFARESMLSNAPATIDGELLKVPAVLPEEEQ